MIKWLLGALLLLVPSLALAQNQGQIVPNGKFTPGHTLRAQNSTGTVAIDGGGSAGSNKSGVGYLTEIGITNTGAPFCINDALINAPGGYHQFCLGANAFGGGLISYNAVGGAAALGLNFNINGTTFSFPGPGNGNVIGPTSPVPTTGNVACWNGGLTLKETPCLTNDAAITLALAPLAAFGNSTTVTANTICINQTTCNTRDVVQSTVNMPAGSTLTGGNAFAGYVLNQASGSGNFANPVAYYSISLSNANNNTTWGANFGLGDGLVHGTPSGHTGQLLVGVETDLQIDNATTGGSGYNIQMGASTAQSFGFDAFALSPGSVSIAGVPTHFTHGLVCNAAATVNSGACLFVGAQALSGTSISSQNVDFAYIDGSSVGRAYTLSVNGGGQFTFQQSQGANHATVNVDGTLAINQGGSLFVGTDQVLASGGAGSIDFAAGTTLTSAVLANGVNLTTITLGNGTADVAVVGTLKYGTFSGSTCTNNGSISIKDSGGATRKVMICS